MVITPDRFRIGRIAMCAVLACAAAALPAWAEAHTPQSSSKDKKLRKDYALIFGTVWNRQDRAVYGAVVKIRRQGEKKARWELISDRSGEFAQRVPPGEADYVVWVDDTRNVSDPAVAKRKLKPGEAETSIHISGDERADVSLHLRE